MYRGSSLEPKLRTVSQEMVVGERWLRSEVVLEGTVERSEVRMPA